MGRYHWSEDILIVKLPVEPRTSDEIQIVAEMVCGEHRHDVILDFSRVDVLATSTLCALARLKKTMDDCGYRLVFHRVAPLTRGIFVVHGFERIFEFINESDFAIEPSQEASGDGELFLSNGDGRRPKRRNYHRFSVPRSLNIDVFVKYFLRPAKNSYTSSGRHVLGALVDVSEAGAQVVVEAAEELGLEKDQFVKIEMPLVLYGELVETVELDAQIRDLSSTADENSISIGLEMVGLEANPEGRKALRKLCDCLAEFYHTDRSAISC